MFPIVLIGTVHLDVEASSRLLSLLESLKPACIAVEISAFSVRFRSKMERRWQERYDLLVQRLPASRQKHLKLKLLRRQISMAFEWSTAVSYAGQHGIWALPVDSGHISRKELPCWTGELLSEDNLRFLISLDDGSIEAYFSSHYRTALGFLQHPDHLSEAYCEMVFHESWQKREDLLARRIANLSKRFRPLVYIGGWMHLINLPSRVTLVSITGHVKFDRYLITREKAIKI